MGFNFLVGPSPPPPQINLRLLAANSRTCVLRTESARRKDAAMVAAATQHDGDCSSVLHPEWVRMCADSGQSTHARLPAVGPEEEEEGTLRGVFLLGNKALCWPAKHSIPPPPGASLWAL